MKLLKKQVLSSAYNAISRLLPKNVCPVFPTKSLMTLKCEAYNAQLRLSQFSLNFSPTPGSFQDIPNSSVQLFNEIIICYQPLFNLLSQASSSFEPFNTFEFFTDGSVKDLTLQSCRLGLGWIQTYPSSPNLTFSASALINPSSSKAEALAILTALTTVPKIVLLPSTPTRKHV